MKRTIILLTAAIITIGSLTAQIFDHPRHELSVYGGVGLSSLQFTLETGKYGAGVGGHLGGGYTYFITPDFGVGTGLELALYQSRARLANFTDSYDVSGATAADNYTLSYTLKRYDETQQALYLNIPLMLHFQTGYQQKYFLKVGGKVGFPLSATARTGKYDISTQGYFPEEGRTYDDLPQFGFGEYSYKKGSTGLDAFDLYFMLSAEAGLKWKVRDNNSLYAGAYVDYGLNNIQKTNDKTFVRSQLSADLPPMSPLIESRHAATAKPFTDKITPLSVGLKVRFTFLQ